LGVYREFVRKTGVRTIDVDIARNAPERRAPGPLKIQAKAGHSDSAMRAVVMRTIPNRPDAGVRPGDRIPQRQHRSVHPRRSQLSGASGRRMGMNSKLLVLLTVGALGSFVAPAAASAADNDRDGLSNQVEKRVGLNPNDANTDNDCVPDGAEDMDNDGVDNDNEVVEGTKLRDADTDNDGVRDGREDADGDHLNNHREDEFGTNPKDRDTDNDGVGDAREDDDGDHVINRTDSRDNDGDRDEHDEDDCSDDDRSDRDEVQSGRSDD
jgi:hypothetical protein